MSGIVSGIGPGVATQLVPSNIKTTTRISYPRVTVTSLPSLIPRLPIEAQDESKAHHVPNGGGFRNPWPSAADIPGGNGGLMHTLKMRFGSKRPAFVPVPKNREGLVKVRDGIEGLSLDGAIDSASSSSDAFKVSWIGHASFFMESSRSQKASLSGGKPLRGVRILCDPVWSERTSPFTFLGPKRYSETPMGLDDFLAAMAGSEVQELRERRGSVLARDEHGENPDLEIPVNGGIDLILLSHNHYDHADLQTLKKICMKFPRVKVLIGLGSSRWLQDEGVGLTANNIIEMDWWDQAVVDVQGVGRLRVSCCPTQHFSARWVNDRDKDLWCSFAIEDLGNNTTGAGFDGTGMEKASNLKKIYFSGDTGYRTVIRDDMTREEEDQLPVCPTFKYVGDLLGPFDLSLLPIGLCSPRNYMSRIHANSWDSIRMHQDLKSKKSVGMHYGTVRGGLSQEYEDVRTPPKDWRQAAEEAGLKWGEEIALMDIGETIVVK